MTRLTDEDYKYLSGLGIATVVDLRTSQERTLNLPIGKLAESTMSLSPTPLRKMPIRLRPVYASPDVTPEDGPRNNDSAVFGNS
jgi:hypothetical protein